VEAMNLLTLFRDRLIRGSNGGALMAVVAMVSAQAPSSAHAAENAIVAGSNVTLIASADGSPVPTFQWRKNGVPIAGATGQMFAIVGATVSDAATYQVVATNEAGSAVSPDEVLVVEAGSLNVAPVFTTQPTPTQSLSAGATATFTVSASGIPTPTFQWHKNGSAMSGFTDATLTLTNISSSDGATYTAVATNSAGSVTSDPAILTIATTPVPPLPTNVAPEITTQPTAAQSVLVGGSVSFTAAASGTPAPTFQWFKNGVTLVGATNATLSVLVVTAIDGGTYTAVASNAAGSATTNAAVLTVTEPIVVPPPPVSPPPVSGSAVAPSFTTQPDSQTLLVGSNASLTVAVTGNPAPTLHWLKNGKRIAGATSATLSIAPVTTVDAGTYSVIATNAVGSVTSANAIVTVKMAPMFTLQPKPQAVAAGTTARFSVAVSAIPGATLQWHKDGVALPGATTSVLTLTSASSRDVGTYNVVATNAVGSVTSTSAALVIGVAPVITQQPGSQIVAAKANVTLSVAASGSPSPSFQWKKDGINISGATSATLSLKSVNKADAAAYSVEATNAAGWVASKRATLTVLTSIAKTPREGGESEWVPGADGEFSGTSRLVNLSVRATAGTGSNSLIVGFVVDGSSTKPLLIRGIGPTLQGFGVTGALLDPNLALYSGANVTASNDDWMNNDDVAQIVGTSARVGAFSLPDRASDSALMATLQTGAYTVRLSGKDATSGVALVEVYDTASINTAKLVNLSVRARIGNGSESPNVGFVVAGNAPKRVLIRAIGPALAQFGVTDALSDPQLDLYEGGTRIEQNDNWGGENALSQTFSQVGAFGLADPSSRDAVILATLAPGAYTVVVSGVSGAAGVGLVELYELP
jgi:hypothetical protein